MSTTCDIARSPKDGVRAPDIETLRTKLLVVGGGMAAHGFCKGLFAQGVTDSFDVTIFGDEPHLAYDRVNLSKLFDGRSKEDLILSDQNWYDDHRITFKTGSCITRIDRVTKQIFDQDGNSYEYDHLVLATGSHPFVPPVPGRDLDGVFVYRTLDDLAQIQAHVQQRHAITGAVIGGGLLGLEAAKILHDLGLKTSVIEMAPGLMPRQLDQAAAVRLREHVESIGVDVHLVRRTERIADAFDGGLSIEFSNAESINVDVLIIAAGVRPNDMIAKDAGLELGTRGGIAVNESLETSDPNIFAIGECAAFADHIYGLVAPCYRMAETLAQRLSGKEASFHGADESAELKLMGVQVVTLGRAIGQSAGGIVLSQQDDDAYRKLIIEQGKVVGAACVGPWLDLPQVRQAIHRQRMLWPIQRARFRKTGSPWISDGSMTVHQWPADAIVCSCMGITRGLISSTIDQGSDSIEQVAKVTKASTACGSCKSLVCELIGGDATRQPVPGAKTMLVASTVAAIFTLLAFVVPPIEMATSVQSAWRNIDVLWRDDFARQVTGFTTLGLTLLGLVFSLRKRTNWFQFGSYAFWRSVHAILGTAVLAAIAVHTGMRLGENLNFVLGVVFLSVAAIGSLAGITSSLESKVTGSAAIFVRRWRPRLTLLHTLLFWPLPALVALHVFSFYWFTD